jgi:trimethylamine--corrinoid protein Co-methyltransferase
MIQLLDSLDHIDFVMSGFIPKDVPVHKVERIQMQAMLQRTNKPIIYVTTDVNNTKFSIAMAEAIAGGAEELQLRPFAANYVNIANPLRHNPESIQKLIWLSRKGLPFTYRAALITRGISGPVTGAGFLTVNNAASLAGLTLSQLVREGTPFIRDACAGGTFDMRHMVGQFAAPEIRGFNEELLHFYGLPGFGIGGVTGAKAVDGQAVIEAALTLLTSVLAGAQLLHDVGYMDNGVTGSFIQLTICNEIISWIKPYMRPLMINEESIALDAIRKVVETDGDFLASKNTARHYREDFFPKLLERRSYDAWKMDGGRTLNERASEYVEHVLAMPPKETLTAAQASAVQRIIDEDL